MKEHLVCCPNCHTEVAIDQAPGDQFCPTCGWKYRIQDGIINFMPDDKFYWGEIPYEEMVRVNCKAAQVGWYQAYIDTILPISKRDMMNYMFSPVRIAGMFHYYHPERRETCLDLGSGCGPISFGLSKYYKMVYSVDGVYERLQFQAIRAGQDGVSNIKIIKSTMLKLPFLDHSMDAVIVNGLLEWIGLSDAITDPRVLQVNFLKEVNRVLKPDGNLFIGIENRVGAEYFIGATDHSGMRFTNFMPRWLASRVVNLAERRDVASFFSGAETSYRTYTYTCWGYRKLLQEAGFSNTKIYWSMPDYNQPCVSGSLDAASIKYFIKSMGSQRKSSVKRPIFWMVQRIPNRILNFLVKVFAPYFLIVSSKTRLEGGIQETALGARANSSFVRTTYHNNGDLEAAYEILDGEKPQQINIQMNPLPGQPLTVPDHSLHEKCVPEKS